MSNRMKQSKLQRLVTVTCYVLGGVLAVGAILDSVGNAISLLTPTVALCGSILIVVSLTVCAIVMENWSIKWASGSQTLRLRRLGIKPIAFAAGAIILMWSPYVMDLLREEGARMSRDSPKGEVAKRPLEGPLDTEDPRAAIDIETAHVPDMQPAPEKATPEPPVLNISLAPFDPRFLDGGKLNNWGGGSQSLFVETESPVVPATTLRELVDSSNKEDKPLRVWENLSGGVRIKVDAVYDGEQGQQTCIVQGWGIEVTTEKPPKFGLLSFYSTGGASAARDHISIGIEAEDAAYFSTHWYSNDEIVLPWRSSTYLVSGEPVFLLVDPVIIDLWGTQEWSAAEEVDVVRAISIRICANVLVNGRKWRVKSIDSIRLVIPGATVQRNFGDWNLIEDLRPEAFTSIGREVVPLRDALQGRSPPPSFFD